MSQLARIAEITGATTADVVRVATRGGTSAADWVIAHGIEAVTTRPAAETMWAERARRPEPDAPAPTNPRAVHDPEVAIYPENTGPEDTSVAPHHPGDDTPDTDQDQAEDVEEFAARVYSDLDDLLLRTTNRSTARLVRGWNSTSQARREVHGLLRSLRRPRGRAGHLALVA